MIYITITLLAVCFVGLFWFLFHDTGLLDPKIHKELDDLYEFIDNLPPAEKSYGGFYQYKDIEFKRRMSHCNKIYGVDKPSDFFPLNKKTGIRYADYKMAD